MLTAKYDTFSGLMDEIEGEIAGAATGAMRHTAEQTRDRLRRQTIAAGLGSRLPNTWTARAYPAGGKNSINPAGLVYSRAPDIMDAFTKGATIRPLGGDNYLWIPTKNVPRARSRSSAWQRVAGPDGSRPRRLRAGALTPEECESRFDTDFIVRKGGDGRRLAFMDLVRARNGRGVRGATTGRRRQGRTPKLTLMFVLTKTAKMPKLFDLDREAEAWASAFDREFTGGLPR